MPLAQELEERLRECYVLKTRQSRELIFTYAGKPHRIGRAVVLSGLWSWGTGVESRGPALPRLPAEPRGIH
jgi:hypothetical protein